MVEWLSKLRRVRSMVVVVAAVAVVMVAVAFVLAGDDLGVAGSRADQPPPRFAAPLPPDWATPIEPAHPLGNDGDRPPLPALPDTDNPNVYAAAVAEVLFGMDYAQRDPEDYRTFFGAALWDEIVPEARTSITQTISQRVPTAELWEQMRAVEQVAELDVGAVWEPRLGREGRENDHWPDGMVMRTVSGTQTETWRDDGGATRTSTRPVAVTVVVACPPASSPCRLVGILPGVES